LEIWIGHRRQLVAETMSRIELESDLALSRRAAKTDPLTGLMNRGGIDEVFETLDRSNRVFSLLMIDVDHFKRVNDTLGHDAGDAVLADVARVLAENLRGEDLVCRWGGEEFVGVVFSNDPVVVLAAAERIRSAVSSQVECGEFPVTVSIGVAHCDGRTPVERLLKVADVALLQAKRSGRDLVVTGST
jgi:diguanylate cyclase (GGDEF)-like protein